MLGNDSGPDVLLRNQVEAATSLAELETQLLLEGIFRRCGYDFRSYAPVPLKRRIAERMRAEGTATVTGLLERALHDPLVLERLLYGITTQPGKTPFRDTAFFANFTQRIIPRLRTYPFFRIWISGCGNGSDVYAIAILLHEAGLKERARIYATEATETAVEEARRGQIARDSLAVADERYREAGGTASFSDYLEDGPDGLHFAAALRSNVLFARHHLASEGSFNEFEAVLVHNTLSLYNGSLGYRVHQTLHESIARLGFLCIGPNDTISASPHRHAYEAIAGCDSILRRLR